MSKSEGICGIRRSPEKQAISQHGKTSMECGSMRLLYPEAEERSIDNNKMI